VNFVNSVYYGRQWTVYQFMGNNLLAKSVGGMSMPLSRGERLRRLREQRGVEQKEVAAGVGLSAPYLSMIERDQKGRNLEQVRPTLRKLAGYYNVMPEYLEAQVPQEYMAAFIRAQTDDLDLYSVGRRLEFVLDELQLRWGDEYTLDRVAETLGTSVKTMRAYMAGQILLGDDIVLQRLTAMTGVASRFFVPDAVHRVDGDPELRRVFELAVAQGISAEDLELMIHGWLAARHKTGRPPG
jgi:transcriptional regulator with XRE-family HTH domain